MQSTKASFNKGWLSKVQKSKLQAPETTIKTINTNEIQVLTEKGRENREEAEIILST